MDEAEESLLQGLETPESGMDCTAPLNAQGIKSSHYCYWIIIIEYSQQTIVVITMTTGQIALMAKGVAREVLVVLKLAVVGAVVVTLKLLVKLMSTGVTAVAAKLVPLAQVLLGLALVTMPADQLDS